MAEANRLALRCALNRLRQEPIAQMEIKSERLKAGRDEAYLPNILQRQVQLTGQSMHFLPMHPISCRPAN